MRVTRFKGVLDWLGRRMLGSTAAMGEDDAAAYVDHLNSALRMAWEFDFWPEWTPVEERYFRALWDSGTAYAVGDEVYSAGSTPAGYWRCTHVNTNSLPGVAAINWEAGGVDDAAALRPYVSLEQAGQTAIGEVDEVFDKDPRVAGNGARALGYRMGFDGVEMALCGTLPATVWVRFRRRPPEFTSEIWKADTTYRIGARVYDATLGDCYVATAESINVSPLDEVTDDTGLWDVIGFPFRIAEAVKQLAYAEALEDDGQNDKAGVQMNNALEVLAAEWLKVAPEGQSRVRRK